MNESGFRVRYPCVTTHALRGVGEGRVRFAECQPGQRPAAINSGEGGRASRQPRRHDGAAGNKWLGRKQDVGESGVRRCECDGGMTTGHRGGCSRERTQFRALMPRRIVVGGGMTGVVQHVHAGVRGCRALRIRHRYVAIADDQPPIRRHEAGRDQRAAAQREQQHCCQYGVAGQFRRRPVVHRSSLMQLMT